jgi:hypothetical protein
LLPFFLLLTNCDAGDIDESVGLWNLLFVLSSAHEREEREGRGVGTGCEV